MASRTFLSFLLVAAGSVSWLMAASPWQKVNVPFAFQAGDSELAAGTYRVLARSEAGTMVIKLIGTGGEAEVPVFTRLARTSASAAETNLVFDTVEGNRHLSEVWIAGEEGFLVRGNLADEQHEHVILTGEEAD